MQDKGISSTFKKIVSESSEMVFLADAIYPYSIFYANESFEEQVGATLTERSLVELGFDLNTNIFKEEVVFSRQDKEYSFKLDLPEDGGSGYFLFYKGKEIKIDVRPVRKGKRADDKRLIKLRERVPELSRFGKWTLDFRKKELDLEESAKNLIAVIEGEKFSDLRVKSIFLDQVGELVSSLHPQGEFKGRLQLSSGHSLEFVAFFPESEPSQVWGILWDGSRSKTRSYHEDVQMKLWWDCPEALIVVEPDGRVFLANREANALFGFDEHRPIQHLENLKIYWDGISNWSAWLSSIVDSGSVSRSSTLLLYSDGKKLPLEVSSRHTILDGTSYITLSFRNISEKVSLRKKVEASSDFLVNLTEQVPGGLFQMVLNGEGQMDFSFLSKGINTVLGLSQEDIQQFTDISSVIAKVHPQDLPAVVISSVASARKIEPWQCQFRVRAGLHTHEYKWVLGAARPQALENGEMVWYGYLTDITKQKEFEAKLDEARLAAEKANQIKSDFLSMISHELRTPLNAISGSVYSLFQEDPTESQKSALDTINFAVDNLIIMINDLLDFQKIEAGKLTIEQNPMNLKDVIEQVIKGLTFQAKDTGNKLSLELSDGLDILVSGDKTRLSQVMNNLITNALKFTQEGNVDVKIELLGRIRNKMRVHFSVQDTGIGIAKEDQERIFNDFDQVKPSFSSKYGGTGLGLSITRRLLGLMGSQIRIESEVGKGSRFYFELELDLAKEKKAPASNHCKAVRPLEGLHFLMAEDNEVNSLVLGKIIKKWGYTFNRVRNGREAVEAARKENYDCILMDIQMPEMDGFEATMEIKKFSETPIIALTAAAKLEIGERIDECEFEGFVSKPIDAHELLKKVKEVTIDRCYRA